MKQILYFEIFDLGVQQGMEMPATVVKAAQDSTTFNGCSWGFGTDAESALEDMLNSLQEMDFYVAGLEGQIKDGWCPGRLEGDGCDQWYHFGIAYLYKEV
jgi:hypothetical protein